MTDHEKILGRFLDGSTLTRIPAKLKKRRIVLQRLVLEFEPERDYHELEVNEILRPFHPDVAALRRGMIEVGLMTRHNSIYRRVPQVRL